MRCACCDRKLTTTEIIWYKDKHTHEDLCGKCRAIVFKQWLDDDGEPEKIELYVEDILNDIK